MKGDKREPNIKAEIRDWLTSIGAYHFPASAGPYSVRSIPDRIGCFRGKFFAIEVKSVGKVPTDKQLVQIELIRANGGIAFAAWSLANVKDAFYSRWPDLAV